MSYLHRTLPKTSLRFWSNYLVQMRPYLFFVSGIVGLAGMSVTKGFDLLTVPAILTFIVLFFSYGFGQALTDCYQTDTDSLSAPYRPLSKGTISVTDVRVVSATGLFAVALVLCIFNFYNVILCILAILGTWTYTYVKRKLWFAAPGYNSFIIMLLGLMGYLAVIDLTLQKLISIEIVKLAALVFLSYSNFVLIGYLKDISADRATGYLTFPVKFGWNKTLWVGDLVVVLCSIIYFSLVESGLFGIIIGITATLTGISGQLHAHLVKEKKEENSAYAIVSTVRCLVLWQIGVAVTFNPDLLPFCAVFYLFFELVMYLRPMKEQI